MGSPPLGKPSDIPAPWAWCVAKFSLLQCYLERRDQLGVVRLQAERQDIAAILGDEFASN